MAKLTKNQKEAVAKVDKNKAIIHKMQKRLKYIKNRYNKKILTVNF